MAPATLLCTADVHVGRRPSRLPDRADPAEFAPRTVLADLARTAVDRDVDAVLVAGDLVDRENRYAEAYGAVESATETLAAADVPLFCVAGNHDHDVLPDLAADVEGLRLLGGDGTWERVTLDGPAGEGRLAIDGWSFPSRYHHESPLASNDLGDASVPRVGVAHADLGSGDGRYAPVDVDALATSGHAAWVLGHLHGPGLRHEHPPVLYPGSPQPLDPSETGAHGAWLVTLDADGVDARPLDAATLQYEALGVPTTPDDGFHDVVDATHGALRTAVVESDAAPALLAAELTLEGRTAAHGDLLDRRAELEGIELGEGGTTARVLDVAVDTTPPIDLAERAGDDDPVGYLAGLLRALETDDPPARYREVIEAAHARVRATHESNAYRELRTHDEGYERPTAEETKAVVRRQARRLLDAFLDQRAVTGDE